MKPNVLAAGSVLLVVAFLFVALAVTTRQYERERTARIEAERKVVLLGKEMCRCQASVPDVVLRLLR